MATVIQHKNMKAFDQFSADMSKVFSLVGDCCGGDSIQEAIFGWFDGDIDVSEEDESDWIEKYTYSDRGMFNVLYELVNYDIVSLSGKKVNVDESNHPDIAIIVKQYAKSDAINKVYEQIYE